MEEHVDLFLGGRLRDRRLICLWGAAVVLDGPVPEVEEPLVDGDLGAKVGEGVAGEVDDGGPFLLVDDLDVLVSEKGPVLDGAVELDDVEPFEGAEELDELADVLDHGRPELLVCANLPAVELDLVVRDPGLCADGCDVFDVGAEGALTDGHEQRLGEGEVVLGSRELEEVACVLRSGEIGGGVGGGVDGDVGREIIRDQHGSARLLHAVVGCVLHVKFWFGSRVFKTRT